MPAGQGLQAVAPITREKVPAVHSLGLLSPASGQKLPAGHASHVLLLMAPTRGEDVPRGHRLRTLAAALQLELPHAVYEPAGARWHTELPLGV